MERMNQVCIEGIVQDCVAYEKACEVRLYVDEQNPDVPVVIRDGTDCSFKEGDVLRVVGWLSFTKFANKYGRALKRLEIIADYVEARHVG